MGNRSSVRLSAHAVPLLKSKLRVASRREVLLPGGSSGQDARTTPGFKMDEVYSINLANL